MTLELQRFSTRYIAGEDRFLLAGNAADALPVALWLTQRLLQRLLPELYAWHRRHGGKQAASPLAAELPPEAAPALAPPSPQTASLPEPAMLAAPHSEQPWLVRSVQLVQSGNSLRLTFEDAEQRSVHLLLGRSAVAQWLDVLQQACRQAEWPFELWLAPQRQSEWNLPAHSVTLH